jgi:hypothetical protein
MAKHAPIEHRKSALLNLRLSVDDLWKVKQEASKRKLSVSELVRQLLSDLPLVPSQFEENEKKSTLDCSNLSVNLVKHEPEKTTGRNSCLPENGVCAHQFLIVNGRTACPDCK